MSVRGTPLHKHPARLLIINPSSSHQIKSGGHTQNIGFSSTPGVLISMTSFKEISYDKENQTARVGSGLTWDQVYEFLDPHGVTVVGGRIAGVGALR
jgi:FAD/FMN-containing dehydrogenase